MPTYEGINIEKACVLLALDAIDEWYEGGRKFIYDYFYECCENGFNLSGDGYLIEESGPLRQLEQGRYQINYRQGDTYVRITNHETLVRYRVHANRLVLYAYSNGDGTGHAVAIPAHQLLFYIQRTEYGNMFLSKEGLIVDSVQSLE